MARVAKVEGGQMIFRFQAVPTLCDLVAAKSFHLSIRNPTCSK